MNISWCLRPPTTIGLTGFKGMEKAVGELGQPNVTLTDEIDYVYLI